MWVQCAGAHEIPFAHEIDAIKAKKFFFNVWNGGGRVRRISFTV
jgi:hypothetical protein